MAFTVGTIAAKDSGGSAITGGLLAADTTGSGPWFLYHGLVDGVAGSNKAQVDSSNRLRTSSLLHDGTNAVAVKAASTAAAATDPAIVVAISPNGQNANGTTTDANSAPVAWSTEGKAQVGSVTETAPASDTASSGLNGRLQRIAQRIGAVTVVDDAAFTPATTSVLMAGFEADESSTDSVDEGDAGAARMTLDRKVIMTLQPHTAGGLTRSRTLIPNNTTAIVVKASAGQVYKIRATNNSSTIAYIKLYDATSATAGSGTPVDTIMIPAATAGGAGIVDTTDVGVAHATGITYTVTTGIADNDTGAPAATTYVVTVLYK